MPYLPTVNVRGLCPRAGLNEKGPSCEPGPGAQNLGLSHYAVKSEPRVPARHAEESLGQLFQPLVPVLPRLGQDPLHHRQEARLPPVVTGGRLRAGGIAQMGTLKQGACCRGIESRIFTVRQGKARPRISGPRVLIYKRSRHSSV